MGETSTFLKQLQMRKLLRLLPSVTIRGWRCLAIICVLFSGWLALRERIAFSLFDPKSVCVATRDGMQGVVSSNGRVVVPFVWDQIQDFDSSGLAIVSTSPLGSGAPAETRKFGVINRRGSLLIPANFSKLSRNDDNMVAFHAVGSGNLVGFDAQGNRVFETTFRPFSYLHCDSHGIIPGQRGSDVGWFNMSGQLVVRTPGGLTPWSLFNSSGLAIVRNLDGKQGCINLKGELIVPAEWDMIFPGRPSERPNVPGDKFITVKRGEFFGVFEMSGRMLVPPDFKSIGLDGVQRLFVVTNAADKIGCMNFEGQTVIPFEWDFVGKFDENGMALAECTNRQCWINKEGAIVLDVQSEPVAWELGNKPEFDEFGMALVRRDGQWGWISREGKDVIPSQFDIARGFDAMGLAVVAKDFKFGAIDRAGSLVIPLQYASLSENLPWSELLKVELNDGVGCIDRQNRIVVPLQYEWPLEFKWDGMAIAELHGTYRILNSSGQIVSAVSDDELSRLDHDYSYEDLRALLAMKSLSEETSEKKRINPIAGKAFKVENQSGLVGVFTIDHGLLIPPEYEEVRSTSFGFRANGERDGLLLEAAGFIRKKFPAGPPWIRNMFPWHYGYLAETTPLEVLYDLKGNEFWRSDDHWRDTALSYGFGMLGGLSFIRSWRLARKSRRQSSTGS